MRKKSQGHKKRSNITGDVNIIDFVFIQAERSPNVRGFFFHGKDFLFFCLAPPSTTCVHHLP